MNALLILVSIGMLATIVALGNGIGSLAGGGTRSVRLMFWRVGLQGLTAALVFAALLQQHVR